MITLGEDDDEHGDQRGTEHEVGAGNDTRTTQPANGSRPDAGTAPL